MEKLLLPKYTNKIINISNKAEEILLKYDLDTSALFKECKKDDKIKIVFVGQYSAGKSSIIKMLTGEDIKIGSKITTQKATSYLWNGIEIIDTPGVHTELRQDHDKITYEQIDQAALLVFVITNEGFSQKLGEHFRKLAIEQQRAGNMILVVNKMDRTDLGNVLEQQEIIKNDLVKVISEYKLSDLYLSFLDTNSYFDSLSVNDIELKKELFQSSGYDVFVSNINRFVTDHKLLAQAIKLLYRIRKFIEISIEENNVTDDKDLLNLEKTIIDRKRILQDGKDKCHREIRDIIRECREKIRSIGSDSIEKAINVSTQEEADKVQTNTNTKIEKEIIGCYDIIEKKLRCLFDEIGDELCDYDNSIFVQSVTVNIRQKIAETPINNRNLIIKLLSDITKKVREIEDPHLFVAPKEMGAGAVVVGQLADLALKKAFPKLAAPTVNGIAQMVAQFFKPQPGIIDKAGTFLGKNAGKIIGVGGVAYGVIAEFKNAEEQANYEKQKSKAKEELYSKYVKFSDEIHNKLINEVDKVIQESLIPLIKRQTIELENIKKQKENGSKMKKELNKLLNEVDVVISEVQA